LVINPLNLFDIGFQLSFISVLAIILFYPKIMQLAPLTFIPLDRRWVLSLLQSAAVTSAAWVGVAGLIAYYFELVTPVALLSNLIIIPLTSVTVVLGFGLMFFGLFLPWMAHAFAMCIKVMLNVIVLLVYGFDQIPGAYFQLTNFPLWMVLLYYGLIIFGFYGVFLLQRSQRPHSS